MEYRTLLIRNTEKTQFAITSVTTDHTIWHCGMSFDYLAGIDKSVLYHGETLAPVKMDLCSYCISNENIPYVRAPHEQIKDRYVTLTKR